MCSSQQVAFNRDIIDDEKNDHTLPRAAVVASRAQCHATISSQWHLVQIGDPMMVRLVWNPINRSPY